MELKCPVCGSEKLEPGNIQSTGRVYFRPKNTKFLNMKTANVEIGGHICTECGYIMFVGNKEKVKALVSGKEEEQ